MVENCYVSLGIAHRRVMLASPSETGPVSPCSMSEAFHMPGPLTEILLRRHQERKRKDLLLFCDFFPLFLENISGVFPSRGQRRRENGKEKEHDSTRLLAEVSLDTCQAGMTGWV